MPDAAAMVVDVGEDVEATPLPITKQAKRQILQPAINVAVGEENVQKAKTPKLRLLPIQMPQPSWTRAATTATNKPLREMQMVQRIVPMAMQVVLRTQRAITRRVGVADAVVDADVAAEAVVAIRRRTMLSLIHI